MDEQWWKEDIRGAWKERGEESRALIQHQAAGGRGSQRETERASEGRRRRRKQKRKIAFRLCSVKGEITHLRRFFQATTGSIDQTSGFMSQFSTWNIDTENPFYPCLLAFSHSFSLSQSNGLHFWNSAALIRAVNGDVLIVIMMQRLVHPVTGCKGSRWSNLTHMP